MDILELLRSLRPDPMEYEHNRGGTALPSRPRVTKPTKEEREEIERRHEAGRSRPAQGGDGMGALGSPEETTSTVQPVDFGGVARRVGSTVSDAASWPGRTLDASIEERAFHNKPGKAGALGDYNAEEGMLADAAQSGPAVPQRRLPRSRPQRGPLAEETPAQRVSLRSDGGAPGVKTIPPERMSGVGPLGTAAPAKPGDMQTVPGQTGAIESDPWELAAAESANQNGALAQVQAAAPRARLQEEFRKRIDEIEKDTGRKLSPEQKAELQLDFFLRLMAEGSKPGSRLIGAMGTGGLETMKLSRQMRDTNAADAKDRRRDARDDAFRELGFADKDEDNRRGDERLAIDERRHQQRYDLLKQQIEQGRWTVQRGDDGSLTLVDVKSGQTKPVVDAKGKAVRVNVRDSRPAEIQLLEHLRRNPGDMDMLAKLRAGKDRNDSDQIVDAALKLSNDPMNPRTPEEALKVAREIVDGAKGKVPARDGGGKPDPAANKGRVISGPDGRFKSDGKQWVKI